MEPEPPVGLWCGGVIKLLSKRPIAIPHQVAGHLRLAGTGEQTLHTTTGTEGFWKEWGVSERTFRGWSYESLLTALSEDSKPPIRVTTILLVPSVTHPPPKTEVVTRLDTPNSAFIYIN